MIDFLKENVALFSAISTLINLSILGFILKLMRETRFIQKERIEAVRDKSAVIEERLKLAEDEKSRLEKINIKIGEIGDVLGVPNIENKGNPSSGVTIGRDVGDNFSGNIVGRDLNKIDTLIDNSNKLLKNISAISIGSNHNEDKKYEYFVTHPYSKNIDNIRIAERNVKRGFKSSDVYLNAIAAEIDLQSQNGWEFWELSRGHQYGLEDAVLIFRRLRQTEQPNKANTADARTSCG